MSENVFEIYKSLNTYAKIKGIHEQTARQRFETGKVIEVFRVGKRVGYIEVVESVQILSKLL